uniref:CCN family member 3 n=1 Tax=Pavo cristatus TaxID=9049 RepID=A0A8C9FZA4_PAVCR
METGGGQGLPVLLLLLLLLRPCEASAGAQGAGAVARAGAVTRGPRAALSPQVSGREAACPRPCGGRCPAEPPRCPPGVPAVLDGCGCCLVCARQRGESCSPLLPCDESGGLYCDRGSEDGGGTVLEGDNCVFDGMIYRNGETFQPSCKYQCTCRDGQIGCLPRCNLGLLLPGPDCPFPRKIEVPGECCEKWVCDPRDEVLLGGFPYLVCLPGQGSNVSDSSANCIEQTTEWSACSKSCGMGFSTRVTNRNQQCEMVKQTRLCMMRPCENEDVQTSPKCRLTAA